MTNIFLHYLAIFEVVNSVKNIRSIQYCCKLSHKCKGSGGTVALAGNGPQIVFKKSCFNIKVAFFLRIIVKHYPLSSP